MNSISISESTTYTPSTQFKSLQTLSYLISYRISELSTCFLSDLSFYKLERVSLGLYESTSIDVIHIFPMKSFCIIKCWWSWYLVMIRCLIVSNWFKILWVIDRFFWLIRFTYLLYSTIIESFSSLLPTYIFTCRYSSWKDECYDDNTDYYNVSDVIHRDIL